MTSWQLGYEARRSRLETAGDLARGKVVAARDATRLLEAVVRSGDRVCIEGDNQKQADVLSAALLAVDVAKVNGLHMIQSGVDRHRLARLRFRWRAQHGLRRARAAASERAVATGGPGG